ncbi:hypothetical protein RB195_006796 [Necator americanus]
MISFVLCLFIHFQVCVGYKFLIYSPFLGHSHVTFLGRIADVLTNGGHDVTVVMPEIDTGELERTGVRVTKKIIRTPGDMRARKVFKEGQEREYRDIWTSSTNTLTMLQIAKSRSDILSYQCEILINDDALLEQLREEKFDAAIAEVYYICGLGLFEALNITTTMAVTALTHLDSLSYTIGEPIALSYVPWDLSSTNDRMTFLERFRNLVGFLIGQCVLNYIYESELVHFRKKFGTMRDYKDLIAQTSFVFTNGNPYVDFPHPTIHKTVMIGGISVEQNASNYAGSLEKWDKILNVRQHNVLVSFGSMAKSVDMPIQYK